MVACGDVWWFAVVCSGLSFSHTGNSTVTRVTFLSSCDTEFNIIFTILLLSNPSCVCC